MDDGFKVGDYLIIKESFINDEEKNELSNKVIVAQITYITSYSQLGGNVILGFQPKLFLDFNLLLD